MSRFSLRRPIIYYRMSMKGRKSISFLLFFLCTIVIILMCLSIFTTKIYPTIIAICESKAKSIAIHISTYAVSQKLKHLKYEDLITYQKDNDEKISMIKADVIEMSKISSDISAFVQQELESSDNSTLKIPIGSFLGNDIMSSMGPDVKIRIIPVGNVESDFKTEFTSCGINQTRHKIYLQVKCKVRVVLPFASQPAESISMVPIAETVIVGSVPSSFYNLEGLNTLEKKDSIPLIK